VATIRGRERYATNLRNRSKGRGSRSYHYYLLLSTTIIIYHLLCRHVNPSIYGMSNSIALAHLIETMDSAHVSFGSFLVASVAPGSCVPFASSDSHACHNGHSTVAVIAPSSCRIFVFPAAPTYSRIALLLSIIAHAVPKVRANHAEPRSAAHGTRLKQ